MYIGGSVMYVQNITNNIAFQGGSGDLWKRVVQWLLDTTPEITLKEGKKAGATAKKLESEISKPHVNRLIMGTTAMVTQPFIDYHNHNVDEETRSVARNRTIAKIIAGTGVGIGVRKLCYDATQKMTDINGVKKYSKALLPEKSFLKNFVNTEKKLGNYRNALSTAIAILVMCFATNFLLDAPLTTYFTNRLNERTARKKEQELKATEQKTHENEVSEQRKGLDVYA